MTSLQIIYKTCKCYWKDRKEIEMYRLPCPILEHKIKCYQREIEDIAEKLTLLSKGLDPVNKDKKWSY